MLETSDMLHIVNERCTNIEEERDELKRRYVFYLFQVNVSHFVTRTFIEHCCNTFVPFCRCNEVEAELQVAIISKETTEITTSEKVCQLENAIEEVIKY